MSEPSLPLADLTPQQKRALLTQLLQSKVGQAPERFPLSYGQRALWLTYELAPESCAYHVLFSARIRSQVETSALQQAWQKLVDRHAALRMTYVVHDGHLEQHVHRHVPVDFGVTDVSTWEWATLHQHLHHEAQRPFDLAGGPLMRVRLFSRADTEHILLLAIHHIAIDFWALGVLLDELSVLYPAEKAGGPIALPPVDVEYYHFVQWQARMLAGEEGERLWTYWQRQLVDAVPVLSLPTDRPRPPVQTYHGATQAFQVSPELTHQLKALAQAEGVTLHTLLLAAFDVLLHRYTGQEDILVGAFMAGRMRPEFRRLVGYLVNPVVLRARLAGEDAFSALLKQVHGTLIEALKHQDYPFPLLVERLKPGRHASHSPLFQVAFVFQQLHQQTALLPCFVPGSSDERIDFAGLVLEPWALPQQEGQFDLTLEMAQVGTALYGGLKYNTALFEADTVARMAGHLRTLLQGIVANPEQSVATLPLLTKAERRRMLVERHSAGPAYVSDQCLHHGFEAQVEQMPDAIAVCFEHARLTYGELNRRANQLAHYLQSLGVGPGTLVGICVERSLEMVVGVLGILKAGSAYVPLDPAYPKERLAFMIEDAEVPVLLTQAHLVTALPAHTARTVCVDTDHAVLARQSTANPHSGTTPDHLAYVIYTSGSTGKPKGVLVTHRNVTRLFTATQDWFHFDAADVWTLFHSYAFDFSVWELWGALLYGGRLVIVSFMASRSPAAFYELLVRERITVLNQTPSAFRQLMQAEVEAGEMTDDLALRLIIFGGEALDVHSLQPWFARHGDTRPQLVNMYGITETTVHVTYCPLCMADVGQTQGSPIGRPIPDLQLYVLDAHAQPVPRGVAGELYVGGAGVAQGYLKRPELTAERFIDHPLSAESTGRLYKTGDLARYRSDGALEYLGRIDQQVKLRGFRIELGEIEAVLGQHPTVRQTVVMAREDTPGDKRLVAYVVAAAGAMLHPSALRDFLKDTLPEYMVPAVFIGLAALPLTTNGKIDRQALPMPQQRRPALATTFVAPERPIEKALADIWRQVLGVDRVGLDDNFFDLGGDSMRSVQVQAKARSKGLHFALCQLFQHQTIQALAQVISRVSADQVALPRSRAFDLIAETDRRSVGDEVEDAYPLSMFQREMLAHSQRYPEAAIYHDIFSYQVRVHFDGQAWETAWQRLAERHAVLRTWFDFTRFSEPLQLVHRRAVIPLAIDDVRHLGATRQHQMLTTWREAETMRRFDWSVPPLLRVHVHRVTTTTLYLTLSFHHAILDGWSVAAMLTELFEHYVALLHGDPVPREAQPALSFRDFVAQERHALASEAYRQYWTDRLPQATMTLLPRYAAAVQHGQAPQSHDLDVPISAEMFAGLRRLAQSAAVPLKSVMLAAHLRVVSLLSGRMEVLTGVVWHGRPEGPDIERVLGLFLNVVPLWMKLPGGSWRSFVKATFVAEQELFPYRHYPIAHLHEYTNSATKFQVVFNFIHFHVFQKLQDLYDFEYISGRFFDPFPYTLKSNFILNPLSSQLMLNLNHNRNALSEKQIQRIGEIYTRVLSAITAEPDQGYEVERVI